MARLSRAILAPSRLFDMRSRTVRLRLTLLYSGLFLVSGLALLATTYLIFRTNSGVDLIVTTGIGANHGSLHGASRSPEVIRQIQRWFETSVARNRHGLHEGLIESGIALAIMSLVSVALGWLVAGRVLRPLRTITAKTRQISERNLNERLALTGPRDELKDLADTVDGLLARLEAHVEAQQRFAANASHELRTPLSITQTLLDVASSDQDHDHDQLVARLLDVNTRAINLTEALLLLSSTEQRSFTRESVDLSLIAEEATEMLLPLAEQRGVTIKTCGETTPTLGSRTLLLQLATNLVQNAIVHNVREHGTVWVKTSVLQDGVTLTVENTGEKLTPQGVPTLIEPFQRGTERIRAGHAGVGLGLAIVKSVTEAHDGTLSLAPRAAGGLCVTVGLPAVRPDIAS
jgi:two-component system sensor histidine kinase VanS